MAAALAFALLATCAIAGDVESGPSPGAKLAKLTVSAETGEHAGEELDYLDNRKDKPTIYVFVQADRFDRPMARYLKTLDAAVKKIGNDTQVVAVWVTADAEKSKTYLPKAQQSLKFEQTALTVFTADKAGPENWGLNDRASLTTVVADRDKAAARFAYVSLNETDVPAVEAALKKVLEKQEKKEEKQDEKPAEKKVEKPAEKK
jgi:hypothetical protein